MNLQFGSSINEGIRRRGLGDIRSAANKFFRSHGVYQHNQQVALSCLTECISLALENYATSSLTTRTNNSHKAKISVLQIELDTITSNRLPAQDP
jgi:hypothetical protein